MSYEPRIRYRDHLLRFTFLLFYLLRIREHAPRVLEYFSELLGDEKPEVDAGLVGLFFRRLQGTRLCDHLPHVVLKRDCVVCVGDVIHFVVLRYVSHLQLEIPLLKVGIDHERVVDGLDGRGGREDCLRIRRRKSASRSEHEDDERERNGVVVGKKIERGAHAVSIPREIGPLPIYAQGRCFFMKRRRHDATRSLGYCGRMRHRTTKEALRAVRGTRVLVVGDVMLDVYIRGISERLSPEASVPVIEVGQTEEYIGAALGAQVTLVGVVGNDSQARTVRRIARAAGVRTAFVVDPKRPTTQKTRVTSHGKHVARLDREHRTSLPRRIEKEIIRTIRALPKPDMVIVSDYGKSVISAAVVSALKKKCGVRAIVADVKPARMHLFRGVRAIKLNLPEASAILGAKRARRAGAARALSQKFSSSIVLTKGANGTDLYERADGKRAHLPARTKTKEVRDVSGAGDTVTAVLACMLAAGADFAHAVEAANQAGGIAVARHGTAAVSTADILRSED